MSDELTPNDELSLILSVLEDAVNNLPVQKADTPHEPINNVPGTALPQSLEAAFLEGATGQGGYPVHNPQQDVSNPEQSYYDMYYSPGSEFTFGSPQPTPREADGTL